MKKGIELELNQLNKSIRDLNFKILLETDPEIEKINKKEVFRLVNTKVNLQMIKSEILESNK
jgi:hypothetical protein